ncbi:hemolysin activator protein [Actinobacillus lignieresii]|nr:hemolysin activator protein [Actinobacillus lignieresii]
MRYLHLYLFSALLIYSHTGNTAPPPFKETQLKRNIQIDSEIQQRHRQQIVQQEAQFIPQTDIRMDTR